MASEDKTLTCVQCNAEFVFSVGEQQFFEEKGLNAPPKRCKPCRQANKNKKKRREKSSTGYGAYRSPAFEGSAPRHQKIRGRGHRQQDTGNYRAPGFKEYESIKPDEEYRSPAFKEQDGIIPDEEYRSPGFKEYDNVNPNEEYRSPGFSEYKDRRRDERPMFALHCPVCDEDTMVPFLPEERENPMCQDCYKTSVGAKHASPDDTPPEKETENLDVASAEAEATD